MCLVVIAYRARPDLTLLVAANRDEFHSRPTEAASFHEDSPELLAGRDLQSGGTWMGITRGGRFAALTNYRDPVDVRIAAPSRGMIVREFLRSEVTVGEYSKWLAENGDSYAGFGLFYFDGEALAHFSNRGNGEKILGPGIFGLSNHLLDTPWPKVVLSKEAIMREINAPLPDEERILSILRDRTAADDGQLPDTGVGVARERELSPLFIAGEVYGTRSSSVVTLTSRGHVRFTEVRFAPGGIESGRTSYEFDVTR